MAALGRLLQVPGEPAPGEPLIAGFGALAIGTLLIVLAITLGPPLYSTLRRMIPRYRWNREERVPFLVFPLLADGMGAAVGSAYPVHGRAKAMDDRDASARVAEPLPGGRETRAQPSTSAGIVAASHTATQGANHSAGNQAVADGAAAPRGSGDASIQAVPPAIAMDGGAGETLQLLPGRLEVLSGVGSGSGREIRFVRTGPLTEVTLGRADGESAGHVQLAAPTVSRRHALLRHDKGKWTVANLSSTNPLRLNGKELAGKRRRLLRSGDRLELGEVMLVFHER